MTPNQTGWIMAGLGFVLAGFLCGGFVDFAIAEPDEAVAIIGVVLVVSMWVTRNEEEEG